MEGFEIRVSFKAFGEKNNRKVRDQGFRIKQIAVSKFPCSR